MKKAILALGLCLASIAAVSAQEKGDMAAGINLGVAPCLESGASVTNFGVGAKFQYNITTPIRLEAAFDYGFKDKEIDVMTIGVNAHYIFKLSEKFNIYPLVGLGYAHLSSGGSFDADDFDYDDYDWSASRAWDDDDDYDYDYDGGSSSLNRFFFNVGVGAEYALTEKLSLGLEVKYQYIKDFNRLPINLGVTYRF